MVKASFIRFLGSIRSEAVPQETVAFIVPSVYLYGRILFIFGI
jgi:hypothetical protein